MHPVLARGLDQLAPLEGNEVAYPAQQSAERHRAACRIGDLQHLAVAPVDAHRTQRRDEFFGLHRSGRKQLRQRHDGGAEERCLPGVRLRERVDPAAGVQPASVQRQHPVDERDERGLDALFFDGVDLAADQPELVAQLPEVPAHQVRVDRGRRISQQQQEKLVDTRYPHQGALQLLADFLQLVPH